MTGDRFFEAVRRVVWRVLDDQDRVDRRARYPARVLSQSGQQVDVAFDDERLPVMRGVPLAPIPGHAPQLSPGTRVLVGWKAGDERFPQAYLEWDGSGGLASLTVSSTGTVDLNGTHPLPLWDTFESAMTTFLDTLSTQLALGTVGGPVKQDLVGIAAIQTAVTTLRTALSNGSYDSQKVRNG